MTDTGSLGPIDAQVTIGRSRQSAHDYIEWVSEKMNEAHKEGELNPFDATMIAHHTRRTWWRPSLSSLCRGPGRRLVGSV